MLGDEAGILEVDMEAYLNVHEREERMADLFTYGELTRPEVMEKLLGRLPPSRPAVLLDHRRALDEEVGFFRAIPSRGSRIDGLLYEGLDPEELTKLDVYEEVERGLYERVAMEVRLGGVPRRAWIYVAPGSTSAGT